jgi:YidC/Oxa1 family membrane protein insertase
MWDTYIINPMVNALLFLYGILGTNFFLAIAVFTLLIRLLTMPLTMRQQRASMRMQEMQPEVQRIQKKYRDNPQKMQEEFRKIGYNPAESLMGCLPLLIQFPILIGLYRAILLVLGSTPLALFELTQRVYPAIDLTRLLPVGNQFYWLNLAQPDPLYILPIAVAATTYFSQKLSTAAATRSPSNNDKKKDQQDESPMAGMTQSMQYTMPLMFGFISLQFPAGLSLYFILSNLIGAGQGLLIRRSMPDGTGGGAAQTRTEVVEEEEEEVEAESGGSDGASADGQKPASSSKGQKRKSGSKKRKRR